MKPSEFYLQHFYVLFYYLHLSYVVAEIILSYCLISWNFSKRKRIRPNFKIVQLPIEIHNIFNYKNILEKLALTSFRTIKGIERFYVAYFCTRIHKHSMGYISKWIWLGYIFELLQKGNKSFPLCMKYLAILMFLEDFFLHNIFLHLQRNLLIFSSNQYN